MCTRKTAKLAGKGVQTQHSAAEGVASKECVLIRRDSAYTARTCVKTTAASTTRPASRTHRLNAGDASPCLSAPCSSRTQHVAELVHIGEVPSLSIKSFKAVSFYVAHTAKAISSIHYRRHP